MIRKCSYCYRLQLTHSCDCEWSKSGISYNTTAIDTPESTIIYHLVTIIKSINLAYSLLTRYKTNDIQRVASQSISFIEVQVREIKEGLPSDHYFVTFSIDKGRGDIFITPYLTINGKSTRISLADPDCFLKFQEIISLSLTDITEND